MLQLLAESKFTYLIYIPVPHDLLFVSLVLSKAHLGTLLSPLVCLTTSVTQKRLKAAIMGFGNSPVINVQPI